MLLAGLFLAGLFCLAVFRFDAGHLLRPETLWRKLIFPIIRTTVFISLGLLAGQLIESLGWTSKMGRLAWPLIRWARLPGEAGASFTSAFVSGVLANTMLLTSWQEGRLTRRELILTNLLNASIPAYVLHLPSTMLIILSLTGSAGAVYVALTFSAALIRLVGVAFLSRLILPACEACRYEEPGRKRPFRQVWAETWPKFKSRLKRIVIIIVPVYLAVVLAAEAGLFTWLRTLLAGLAAGTVAPVETMGIIIFSVAAEFTSGFAAAGALLESGTLTVMQVVLALLIGNVVATPIRALRHQLPNYMGIYTPKLGVWLIVLGQSLRILSVVLVILALVLLY
ncbi:MAG: hypothetical protein V1742_07555 [Pseudomonadota bacterium]